MKALKRTIALLLALFCMTAVFSSCDNTSNENSDTSGASSEVSGKAEANISCSELLALVTELEKNENIMLYSSDGEQKLDEFMVLDLYSTLDDTPDMEIFEDYALFMPNDPIVSECHIFKLKNTKDMSKAKSYLNRRLDALRKKFVGYKPEQVAAAEDGEIFTEGSYIVLIATMENNDAVKKAIKNKING